MPLGFSSSILFSFSFSESSKPPSSPTSSIQASEASVIGRPRIEISFFGFSISSVTFSVDETSSLELPKPHPPSRSSIQASEASVIGSPKEDLFSFVIKSCRDRDTISSLSSLTFSSSSESEKAHVSPLSSIQASVYSVNGSLVVELSTFSSLLFERVSFFSIPF